MNFAAFIFYPFLILSIILFYVFLKKIRWVWLLAASYVFYSFTDLRLPLLLLFGTLTSYGAARMMERTVDRGKKKVWLWLGMGLSLVLLFTFKYLNFALSNLAAALSAAGYQWHFRGVDLLIPLGLSFYTFTVLAYLLDVFNGKIAAEKHLGQYALFVSFFPKLLMGPIERYKHLQPQFSLPKPFDYQTFVNSLLRIGWGLFKKLVVADRLAVIADTVFNQPHDFYAVKIIAAVLAFSFQIYLDFSAYTDIAIGAARLFGIELMENFDHPFLATSVIDFWRRWHISLSNWLRDYIFVPLNFKHRRKKPRPLWMSTDILLTFLISGIWHGASWTFVLWGLLHGVYQSIELLTQPLRDQLAQRWKIDRSTLAHRLVQIVFTFVLVSSAWMVFRANTLSDALYMGKSVAALRGITVENEWVLNDGSLGLDAPDFVVMLISLTVVLTAEFVHSKSNLLLALLRQPRWFRWGLYLALLYAIIIFAYAGQHTAGDFIYMQF